MTTTPLASMTPAEIDLILGRLYDRHWDASAHALRVREYIHLAVNDRGHYVRNRRTWKLPYFEAKAQARRLAEKPDTPEGEEAAQALQKVDDAVAKVAAIDAEIEPYHDEYLRRGGWTRAFLAQSSNGHVHSSMNCSTCHNGEQPTRFKWFPVYSGRSEEEIVADAGERACTVCYPSAPVEVRKCPTKFFTDEEISRQEAREAREAKAAAREAKALAEAISDPEGGALYRGDSRWDKVEKLRSAEMLMSASLAEIIWEKGRIGDPDWTYSNGRTPEIRERDAAYEAAYFHRAIAHKTGETLAEVFDRINPKATAKYRRDRRAADRNHR